MKRRKKPKASSQVRDRYPIEQSGIYPYLVRFLEWFASRGYSPCTVQIRADGIRRFIRWADERGIRRAPEHNAEKLCANRLPRVGRLTPA